MDLQKINTYFAADFRGKAKGGACLHIYPETVFTQKQFEEILAAKKRIPDIYEGLYTNSTFTWDSTGINISGIMIGVDLSDFPKKCHDDILEHLLASLNNVAGIKKVIISDSSRIPDDAPEETNKSDASSDCDDENESGDPYWNEAFGLTKLALNFPAYADGMEGECFRYSVYFSDDTADEEKANAVRNAIRNYDFGLTADVYTGYISVSAEEQMVSVFLDLGNAEPQNENRLIQGILLALNDVPGIKKVIINEDCL